MRHLECSAEARPDDDRGSRGSPRRGSREFGVQHCSRGGIWWEVARRRSREFRWMLCNAAEPDCDRGSRVAPLYAWSESGATFFAFMSWSGGDRRRLQLQRWRGCSSGRGCGREGRWAWAGSAGAWQLGHTPHACRVAYAPHCQARGATAAPRAVGRQPARARTLRHSPLVAVPPR